MSGDACRPLSMRAERPCRLDVAPVHAEPDDASEQVTQALRGEPLTVEERATAGPASAPRTTTPAGSDRTLWDTSRGQSLGRGSPRRVPKATRSRRRARTSARRTSGAGMTERGIDCSGLVHMALPPRSAGSCRATPTSRRTPARRSPRTSCARRPVTYGDEASARPTSRSGSATAGSSTRPSATTRTASSRSPSRDELDVRAVGELVTALTARSYRSSL